MTDTKLKIRGETADKLMSLARAMGKSVDEVLDMAVDMAVEKCMEDTK